METVADLVTVPADGGEGANVSASITDYLSVLVSLGDHTISSNTDTDIQKVFLILILILNMVSSLLLQHRYLEWTEWSSTPRG